MATLTSVISESVEINGAVRGSTQTVSIPDITQVAEKIMEIPLNDGETSTGLAVIGNWAKAVNSSTVYQSYDYNDSEYVRVTNLDENLSIQVAFVSNGKDNQCGEGKAAADSCRFLLAPGQSALMWTTENGKLGEATVPVWSNGLTNLSYIEIYNFTTGEAAAALNVELFVAGKK